MNEESQAMFQSSRLKIKWANKHIGDFNDVVGQFLKTDFYKFAINTDPQTGQNSLKFSMFNDAPCELPMILGDAVHNLRAALDLPFVELVSLIGESPTKWTTFRVWDDRNKLIDTLGKGILKRAPDIVDMLADQVRAYVGGNAMLSALDALDIDDKHVTLIPTFNVIRVDHVDAVLTFGDSRTTFNDCRFVVGQGGVLQLVGFPGAGKVEVKRNGQPSIAVLFGEGTTLKGQAIVPTLTQFSQLVSGVLDIFEVTILARSSA